MNLAYYRKEQGLTQSELAEMSRINRNYFQRTETVNYASLDIFMDIAEALNLPLSKLF